MRDLSRLSSCCLKRDKLTSKQLQCRSDSVIDLVTAVEGRHAAMRCITGAGSTCSVGSARLSFSGLNALAKCQDAMPSKHTSTPTTTTFRP